jgi:plasmid stabilization system protein ParE
VREYWTHTAVEHLLAIYEHIAQDVPLYARRVIERSYRIISRIKTDQIAILAVVHGAQFLPPEL